MQEEEPSLCGLSSEVRRQVDSYMRAQNAELTLLREQVATPVKERDTLRQGQGQLHAAVPQGQGQLHAAVPQRHRPQYHAVPQGHGQLQAAVPQGMVSYRLQYHRGMVSYRPQYHRGMVSYRLQYRQDMVAHKCQDSRVIVSSKSQQRKELSRTLQRRQGYLLQASRLRHIKEGDPVAVIHSQLNGWECLRQG